MSIGVKIENGPSDWQVIQQIKGSADIHLSGSYEKPQGMEGNIRVFARVVIERSGDAVIPWSEAASEGEGRWSITLKDVPAGGLYRIETCMNSGGEDFAIEWSLKGDMIHHLGVGDVYVIAGQSNASGFGKDPADDPPEIGVHVFRNRGRWDLATHPLNEATDTVHLPNMEVAMPGHSPYLSFGRMLKRELGYPIGLLPTALGGSPLKRWNPDEDGDLYRNMMEIIRSQGYRGTQTTQGTQRCMVKGILWYQGCSDTEETTCETYFERFQNMVSHIRRDLGDPELPILTIQLNRLVAAGGERTNKGWGIVREAQRQAAKRISNVYVIPAIDCTLSDGIHISSQSYLLLGERMGKMALAKIYGRERHCMAPDLREAERIDDRSVALIFDNIGIRLDTYGVKPELLPFTIIDDEGEAGIESYEVKSGNRLILNLKRELRGRAVVHGAWEANPHFFVPRDMEGNLPMLSFYGVDIS